MEITLESIRSMLRKTFGFQSYIASVVTRVEMDESISTAAINADGLLKINPQFQAKFVKTPEDTFCLVMHELLHPLFGHFLQAGGKTEAFAADTMINASITRLFADPSREGILFRRFYKSEGMEALLRPNSDLRNSR